MCCAEFMITRGVTAIREGMETPTLGVHHHIAGLLNPPLVMVVCCSRVLFLLSPFLIFVPYLKHVEFLKLVKNCRGHGWCGGAFVGGGFFCNAYEACQRHLGLL